MLSNRIWWKCTYHYPSYQYVYFIQVRKFHYLTVSSRLQIENDRGFINWLRGTERFSVLDWYTDLSTEPFLAHALGYNYRTPRVHTGFYRQYRGLQASIYEYIARYNPTTIFNVGHSLGGALATIGSLDLSMRLSSEVNHNPVQVYNITVSISQGLIILGTNRPPFECSNS